MRNVENTFIQSGDIQSYEKINNFTYEPFIKAKFHKSEGFIFIRVDLYTGILILYRIPDPF